MVKGLSFYITHFKVTVHKPLKKLIKDFFLWRMFYVNIGHYDHAWMVYLAEP